MKSYVHNYFTSPQRDFNLLHGDCIELLRSFDFKFDTIFADPPYFLSNGGFSVQSGKKVSVNKGDWDKSQGSAYVDDFNYRWLKACRDKLKDKGTIWVSGTYHNIFSVEKQLERLGFKLLNVVTWAKTNPPPGGWVLDPFAGSSTTGIAALLLGCRFLGIDRGLPFLDMGVARYHELQMPGMMEVFRNKIRSIAWAEALVREPAGEFGMPEFCLP